MVTTLISGNKGYGPFDVSPSSDIYECDATASVRVNNAGSPIAQTGWRLRLGNAPKANAQWIGGEVVSDNLPSEEWTAVHGNDGPGFFLGDAQSFTVKRLKLTDVFDGIRGTDNTSRLTVDTCWIVRHRDDLIEVDNRANIQQATLIRCYNELGSGHIISSRRGNQATGPTPPVTLHVEANVIQVASIFRDSREKNQYSWNNDPDTSSRGLWKTESFGVATTLFLKDNIFLIDQLSKESKRQHALISENMTLAAGSGGNVLVWTGPQTAGGNGGIAVVSVPKIGGGTIDVPESMIGSDTNRTRILAAFTFTDDIAVWDAAVANWETVVWGGADPGEGAILAANDDQGFNLSVGGVSLAIPVLNNDFNLGTNPVVTLEGAATGPVTVQVVENELVVTSGASQIGPWSQTYRVTNDEAMTATAVAQGQVLGTGGVAHRDTFSGSALALNDAGYEPDVVGANYANIIMPSGRSLQRESGVCHPDADVSNAKVLVQANTALAGTDQRVIATVASLGGTQNANRTGFFLGYANGGGYCLLHSPDQLRLYRLDNNAVTELGAAVSNSTADGDVLELRRIGTTLAILKNGAQMVSVVDATYTHIGKCGLLGGAFVSSTHDWLAGRAYTEFQILAEPAAAGGEPPPIPTGPDTLPHDAAWELDAGAVAVSFVTGPDVTTQQVIVGKDIAGQFANGLFTLSVWNGQARWEIKTATASHFLFSGTIAASTEYEALLSFGAGAEALYLDRALVDQTAVAGWDLQTNGEDVTIGARPDNTLIFGGALEDAQFLTADERNDLLGLGGGTPPAQTNRGAAIRASSLNELNSIETAITRIKALIAELQGA